MTGFSLEFCARNGAWFGVLAIRDVVAAGGDVTQQKLRKRGNNARPNY